jgi:hypothetical protein
MASGLFQLVRTICMEFSAVRMRRKEIVVRIDAVVENFLRAVGLMESHFPLAAGLAGNFVHFTFFDVRQRANHFKSRPRRGLHRRRSSCATNGASAADSGKRAQAPVEGDFRYSAAPIVIRSVSE